MFFIYPIYIHLFDSKKTGERSYLKIKRPNLKMDEILLSVFLALKKISKKTRKHFCVLRTTKGLLIQLLMSNPVSLQTLNPKRTNLKMYVVLLSVFLAFK